MLQSNVRHDPPPIDSVVTSQRDPGTWHRYAAKRAIYLRCYRTVQRAFTAQVLFLSVAAVLFSASDRDLVTRHAAPPAAIKNTNNRLQTEQLDVLGSLLCAVRPDAALFRLQSTNVDDT